MLKTTRQMQNQRIYVLCVKEELVNVYPGRGGIVCKGGWKKELSGTASIKGRMAQLFLASYSSPAKVSPLQKPS